VGSSSLPSAVHSVDHAALWPHRAAILRNEVSPDHARKARSAATNSPGVAPRPGRYRVRWAVANSRATAATDDAS
jgi:hypothetical protein